MKNIVKLRRSRAVTDINNLMIANGFNKPLVAFSAGPDSCFLLAACYCLALRKSSSHFKFHACHVNHNLRENSYIDENLSRDICKMFNIDLDIIGLNIKQKSNLYHVARKARYDVLYDCALKNKCDCIMTAHHGDDLVETVVMQMARGVDMEKIGMREVGEWKGMPLLRPLYSYTKKEINGIVDSSNIPYVLDPSNESERTRSKIRKNILPVLKEINPSIHMTMKRIFVKK